MKKNNFTMFCSLLAGIAVMGAGDAFGAIRAGNAARNYAGSYKNTAALEQQYYDSVVAEPDTAVDMDLPVRVADKNLAEKIKRGDAGTDANYDTLNNCAMIYPDGEFVWDRPTMGRGVGGKPTCVAVVEMRVLGANGAYEYTTVARGKLAAGETINCNISAFPSSSYLPDVARVTFPADQKPTREDVIRVMNEEQKDKAGLKIAAGAVAAGLAGNMVGASAPGNDGLFGTNPEKLKSTLGGALIGAALMTASTYSGKVAGDVILHTGINAAAGGVIGNMMATGDSILRVQKCNDGGRETTCLWGTITNTEDADVGDNVYYSPSGSGTTVVCDENNEKCTVNNGLILNYIYHKETGKEIKPEDFAGQPYHVYLSGKADAYRFNKETHTIEPVQGTEDEYYYRAKVAKRAGAPIPAVIVGFEDDSAFGTKVADWNQWKSAHKSDAKICRRDGAGNPMDCKLTDPDGEPYTIEDFNPLKMDADDGGVVDISNKARLGSTLKGAGVGGALGGFSGYQGAQKDIEERFVEATREYNDSLEKIYCGTGKKFLSFYNDVANVPAMKKN